MKPLSHSELLSLPAAIDLRTLGRAFGISESVVRELRRQGKFEEMGIRIKKLGLQYRVVTADVQRALGIEPVQAVAGTSESGHTGSPI